MSYLFSSVPEISITPPPQSLPLSFSLSRLVAGLVKFAATRKALLMGSKMIWPKHTGMFMPVVMDPRFYSCMETKDNLQGSVAHLRCKIGVTDVCL